MKTPQQPHHTRWTLKCEVIIAFALTILFCCPFALAGENSGTSYPVGAQTVLSGTTPPDGKTVYYQYTAFYSAGELTDSHGKSIVPGFRLTVFANAAEVEHNWGVHVLGGSLLSLVAAPLVYEQIETPGGNAAKANIANPDIGIAEIGYNKGSWHWTYGFHVYAPGASYDRNRMLNVGQHYFTLAPLANFTFMPNHGKTEISSKLQFDHNLTNRDTHYQSGNEFIWEYDAMQNVSKKVAVGVNGYFLQQLTDDTQNGLTFEDGHRGRNLAIGPEVRFNVGHAILAVKYFRDTLTQNRPKGNEFWFQFGLPLGNWGKAAH